MRGEGASLKNEFVIIDLETTGLNSSSDKIIEIGAVRLRRGVIDGEFSTLINPCCPVPELISDLTGINTAMVQNAPKINEIIAELIGFIGDAQIVAHNAEFDRSFLINYLANDDQWLDSIILAQIAYPQMGSYSLGHLVQQLNIPLEAAHRAVDDARATAVLTSLCLQRIANFAPRVKAALFALSEGDNSPLGRFIAAQTSLCADSSEPFFFAKRQALPREKDSLRRVVDDDFILNPAEIDKYLEPGGYYEQRLEGFEYREQQLAMARAVAENFNNRGVLLADAGTGTGKSLAYLLPGVLFSLQSGHRIGVSTHTINLQEQIIQKDIPMLKELLGIDFKAKILKGRSNYLCLNHLLSQCRNIDDKMRYFLMRVVSFLSTDSSGDGGELHINSYDRWKWQRICASHDNCIAPYCPFYKGGCFLGQSRREAEDADIFILNHSLLLADAALEGGFLPPLPHLIIDEAHHLEKAAEDQLALSVDFYNLLAAFARLKRRDKGRDIGLLPLVRKHGEQYLFFPELKAGFNEKMDLLNSLLEKEAEQGRILFDYIRNSYLSSLPAGSYYPRSLRITAALAAADQWQELVRLGNLFAAGLGELAKQMLAVWELLHAAETETEERIAGKDELKSIAQNLRFVADGMSIIFNNNDSENNVVWLEFPAADKYPTVKLAPLDLGEALKHALYEERSSLVMTSATLAVGNDFSFFKSRTGLDLLEYSPQELLLPSPFFYEDQVITCICTDVPDPAKTSEIICVERIAEALIKLISASRGRALILFTAYSQLKAVYEKIRTPLRQNGTTVLAHGISGTPRHLLQRLKSEENCCILGTSSFWEGVDVVGERLSLVVIVRLPFWPPNTPITAARLEKLEAEGKASFFAYSLPQAVIRFKQGFGRLIRTGEDSGCFVVLDSRIIDKQYGRMFLSALPKTPLAKGTAAELAVRIQKFLS